MIEDALRETFAATLAAGPPPDEVGDRAERLADDAMRRAARARQRHALGTALAGVLVVALVSVAALQVMTGQSSTDGASTAAGAPSISEATIAAPSAESYDTSPNASPVPLPIEVVNGDEVYTQGKSRVRITLSGQFKPASVWRVKEGYLVLDVASAVSQRLLLIDDRGALQSMLVPSATRIVVSPAGDRIAWLYGGYLAVAERDPGKDSLDMLATTKAPQSGVPVAFLGVNVVLGRMPKDSTTMDAYDVWYPSHNGYTEKWDDSVIRLFGARADGNAMYAQVRDADDDTKICFALLEPEQPFKVTARTCGLPEPTVTGGGISPDGRWLAYPVDGAMQVAAVDLTNLFVKSPKSPVVWNFKTPCARTVWVGQSSLAVDTGDKFVALDPTHPTKQETVQGASNGAVLVEQLAGS